MIEALYEKIMIPESCRLGKRVYKKLFHENAKLSATDKKALRDDVDTIYQPSMKRILSFRTYLRICKTKHI